MSTFGVALGAGVLAGAWASMRALCWMTAASAGMTGRRPAPALLACCRQTFNSVTAKLFTRCGS